VNPDKVIDAALRLAQAPEGGTVLESVIRGESLVLLVDYGIGGIKKWTVPVSQIPIPEAPPVQAEQAEPSQATPPPRPARRRERKK